MLQVYKISGRQNFFSNLSLTSQLIFANVFFYFVSLIILFTLGEDFFLNNFAINPEQISQGKSLWTFFTSMFSHVLFFHIFANMFSLFFIGNFLEKIIGKKRFFLVYIVSGILGGIFFVASGIIFNNSSPGVGASGAIFGLLGVLAVLVPRSKIYLIAGPLILILLQVILSPVIPVNLAGTLSFIFNILIFAMILSMFSFNSNMRKIAVPIELQMWLLPIIAIVPLVTIGFFVNLPIGNSAHIGGLIVGLLYGFYLKQKYPNKTRMISRHFQ